MEEMKWEKPKLIAISSGATSENVLWGSPGSDPNQGNGDPNQGNSGSQPT